ncbi:molybdate ABC transporter substrate-binding protein [soil metagenome]
MCYNRSVTLRLLAALALGLATVAACGTNDTGTTLHVFAAASLTTTFTDLGERFEASHDGVTVDFNFAGSSDLVAQIDQGAPADVLATADEASMARLPELIPGIFATNTMQIVVPPGNPAGVTSLADLASEDMDVVVCAPQVPCGAAAAAVADNAGLSLHTVSEEQSVTDVLGKVSAGEADAGLVYLTDVAAAGDSVQGVRLPGSVNVVNSYPIAPVTDSDLAAEFVALVLSAEGHRVLQAAGFGRP